MSSIEKQPGTAAFEIKNGPLQVRSNLGIQPLDGSRGRQITNFNSHRIQNFEFSPDGKSIGVLTSHIESDVVLLREHGTSGH